MLETVSLHFVGSIAFHAKDYIATELKNNNLSLGNIIRRPIDNLIEYIKKENSITDF